MKLSWASIKYAVVEVFTSTPVIWNIGGTLATAATGEIIGALINAAMLLSNLVLVAYEAISGNRKNMPFGVMVVGGLCIIASVLYRTVETVGIDGLLAPTHVTMIALTYIGARLMWVIGSGIIVLKTNVPMRGHRLLYNHHIYFNIGNMFAVHGAPLAVLFFVLAILRSIYPNKAYPAFTTERLVFIGYILGGLSLIPTSPFFAFLTLFWGTGYLFFKRDENLALIGLKTPARPAL